MLQMRKKESYETRTNHIYYNALYYNSTSREAPSYFQECRTNILIENPNDWHMSVIRFNIPLIQLPVFTFKANPNGTPNNNYYSFTLQYNASFFRRYVQFVPSSPSGLGVYSYSNFIRMLNQALYDVFNDMKTAFPGFPPITAPYFCLDENKINLYTELAYNDPNIQLYMNYPLIKYLYSIPQINLSFDDINGKDSQFIISKTGNNIVNLNPPIPVGSPLVVNGAYRMEMEFSILGNWTNIKSLLMTSNTLRTIGESVNIPRLANTNTGNINIITDFEIEKSSNLLSNPRTFFTYNADIYRFIDLKGHEPIREVDIQLFYSTDDGEIYPLKMPRDYGFSVKILFQRKDISFE